MLVYIAIAGAIMMSVWAVVSSYSKKKKLRDAEKEAERQRLYEQQKNLLQKPLEEIRAFNKEYQQFTSREAYRSNYDIFEFKSKHRILFDRTASLRYTHLPGFQKEIEVFDRFKNLYLNIDKELAAVNKLFVEEELKKCSALFDDVEGRSLDSQQRRAIVINEDNNLVIAGAGSGKTTTIAGKVKYLTQKLNTAPEEILLISFTRKSAEEMAERIRRKMNITLQVKTFHKLGLDIIAECEGAKPSIFGLSQKELMEMLSSLMANAKLDGDYFQKLVDFLAYELKPYKDLDSFKSDAEHNNYLKEQKLEGYKIVEKLTAAGETIRYRERLKSQEEVLIANFLFRHNIAYEYEEKYPYKTASKKFAQYKPDFFLPEHDLYIEHFGIGENGEVPDWFKGAEGKTAQQRYMEGIEWKRGEHQFNNTTLIETYSWEKRKGILLSELQRKLEEKEVLLEAMPDEELWSYITENTPEDIDVFTQLLNTFLSLFKSNNVSIENLLKRARKEGNGRAEMFLELFKPVLSGYEGYLAERGEIDFSDMINLASGHIKENRYISPYQYIIIDEFQDISQSRFQLIKALLDQNPSARLLCVGDDWQSIYRFAGSDIGIFTGFAEYFKPTPITGLERATATSYIENTYRFDNKLIDLSGNFILKNPNQISKSLKSSRQSAADPVTLHRYQDSNRNGRFAIEALEGALDAILVTQGSEKASVLLLGRYEKDSGMIAGSQYFAGSYNQSSKAYDYTYKGNTGLKINFLTAHSSKGLEADYAVILNGNSGTYGFPSEISDDPLLNFVLSKADHFPNGEERRLFYVALTRARKHVHILSSEEQPSKFVQEIEANEIVTAKKCGWCDNGRLVERKGKFGYFYGCNNNHYCNYTIKITAEDFYGQGLESSREKEYENALSQFGKALEIDAKYIKAHYELAKCLHQAKEYEKAAAHFTKAIDMGETSQELFLRRGVSYLSAGKFSEALNDLEKVDAKSPGCGSVHSYIALAYFKTSYIIKAYEHLEKELVLNPESYGGNKLKEKYDPIVRERFTTKEVKVKGNDDETVKGYIKLAITLDINIKFNYRKSEQFDGGEQSLRTVKPSGFKPVGNSDCLTGYCYMRKDDRTFNIDRIENLVLNPGDIEFWVENQG